MRKYGVIGDPISHSLSPLLHGEIYSQIGIPISYNKQLIKNSELSSFVLDNKLQSYNVTIPHKESILHFLDMIIKNTELKNTIFNNITNVLV